jgi:nucleoid-associated protein YgaU
VSAINIISCEIWAGKYMKIFEANRDSLSDPNLIKVGQTLKIPA